MSDKDVDVKLEDLRLEDIREESRIESKNENRISRDDKELKEKSKEISLDKGNKKESLKIAKLEKINKIIDKERETIYKSGFDRSFSDEIKGKELLIIVDLKDEKDLLDYAKSNFSEKLQENLKELTSISYNKETERSVLDTVKELAVYSRIESVQKYDGFIRSKTSIDKIEKLPEEVRKVIDSVNKINVREKIDRTINLKDTILKRTIILPRNDEEKSRKRFISHVGREYFDKHYQTRDVANRLMKDDHYDIKSAWSIDKDKEIDRERADIIESAIKSFNLSKPIETYILTMDKDDMKETLKSMTSPKAYENLREDVLQVFSGAKQDLLREEFKKNDLEKRATWTEDERNTQKTVKGIVKSDYHYDYARVPYNNDFLNFVTLEREELPKYADKQLDGSYIFLNKDDTVLGRISNEDSIKTVLALNLAMIEKDTDKDAADFLKLVDKSIDKNLDIKENGRNVARDIAVIVRQAKYQMEDNRESLKNGDRVVITKEKEETPHREEPRFRTIEKEAKPHEIFHKGDLRDLNLTYVLRNTAIKTEERLLKDADKRLKPIEKTNKFIEELSKDRAVIEKLKDPVLEKEMTINSAQRYYGDAIEKDSQRFFEVIRFGNDKDRLAAEIEIEKLRENPEENKDLLAAYDMKVRIANACLKGTIDSIVVESRYTMGGDTGPKRSLHRDIAHLPEFEREVRILTAEKILTIPAELRNKPVHNLIKMKNDDGLREFLTQRNGYEPRNADLKMFKFIAKSIYLERFERTMLALVDKDNKQQSNFDIQSMVYAKLEHEDKTIFPSVGTFKEMYGYHLLEASYLLRNFEQSALDKFDYINSSKMRLDAIENIKDSDYDQWAKDINKDPKLDKSLNPIRHDIYSNGHMVWENGKLYLEDKIARYNDMEINFDARQHDLLLEEIRQHVPGFEWMAEMMAFSEGTFITNDISDMVKMDDIKDGKDLYLPHPNGQYESATMGLISLEKVKELNEGFNELMKPDGARPMIDNKLDIEKAIEYVARYDKLDIDEWRVLNEEQVNDYKFDFAVLRHNITIMRDSLQKSFIDVNDKTRTESKDIERKFKDVKFKDLFDRNKLDPEFKKEYMRYFKDRVNAVKRENFKRNILLERDEKRNKEDKLGGIKDRRLEIEKRRDEVKLELDRTRVQIYNQNRDMIRENIKAQEGLIRNTERLKNLEQERDAAIREKAFGVFKKITEMRIRKEYMDEINRVKGHIAEYQKIISDFKNYEKVGKSENNSKIEILENQLNNLRLQAHIERAEEEEKYVVEAIDKLQAKSELISEYLDTKGYKEGFSKFLEEYKKNDIKEAPHYRGMYDFYTRKEYEQNISKTRDVKFQNKIRYYRNKGSFYAMDYDIAKDKAKQEEIREMSQYGFLEEERLTALNKQLSYVQSVAPEFLEKKGITELPLSLNDMTTYNRGLLSKTEHAKIMLELGSNYYFDEYIAPAVIAREEALNGPEIDDDKIAESEEIIDYYVRYTGTDRFLEIIGMEGLSDIVKNSHIEDLSNMPTWEPESYDFSSEREGTLRLPETPEEVDMIMEQYEAFEEAGFDNQSIDDIQVPDYYEEPKGMTDEELEIMYRYSVDEKTFIQRWEEDREIERLNRPRAVQLAELREKQNSDN